MNSHEVHHEHNQQSHIDQHQPMMPRRHALAALGVGAASFAGAAIASSAAAQPSEPIRPRRDELSPKQIGWDPKAKRYVLPRLPYEYNALEPYIDEQTMRLHHDKHHAGYVRGLNSALDALEEIRAGRRSESEIKHWSRQLAFNGSGHLLHVIFWNCMGPQGGGRPSGIMGRLINESFGSYTKFANHFKSAAGSVEGSGWGLLVLEPTSRQLMVMQAEKHQNLTAWGVVPLVVVDVWEHAYYLKYQNRRSEYVDAFMNVINWDIPNRMLDGLMQSLSEYGPGGRE